MQKISKGSLRPRWVNLAFASVVLVLGCGDPNDGTNAFSSTPLDPEYGKQVLDAPPNLGKEDNATGIKGPEAVFAGGPSEVWPVENDWEDRDTVRAREAGIAWPENSGLDWNEKYTAWIDSLQKIEGVNFGETFELVTPQGVRLPAPSLECAETSVFLRVSFAAWYNLPFYISAWDGGQNIHFGHFGVVRDNTPHSSFPSFRNRYPDYSHMSIAEAQANWPSDPKLVKRFLTASKDDENTFLGEGAYSGAYFDRIFLNKRVGHFLVIVLTYTGSIHLASTDNTFNLKADAVRVGDTLLKRWQRKGIGHTMVVKRVDLLVDSNQLDVELMSGSMPRRQPRWETAASSKYAFTDKKCGGEGENAEGDRYATLGGGIKRWRLARVVNGRWRNVVGDSDKPSFIPFTNQSAISERPGLYGQLLADQNTEQKVITLMNMIETKREHLRNYPASCSARIAREAAFDELYVLTEEAWTWTKEQTDLKYRKLEDYVFAELDYAQSRTCCWNSSTAAMYDIAMSLNEERQEAAQTEESCAEPVVFMMRDGGYGVFASYAESLALDDVWVPWSADESCPQEHEVLTDTEAEHRWTPWCELPPPVESGPPGH